jgi:hypothetical protein
MSVKCDGNTSVFGGAGVGKGKGGQKSEKSIPNLGVNELGNLQQETQQEEGRSRMKVDGFEMLKRVPVFTGTEDVEEWLWKIGFLVDKFQNREEELIDGLRYRLAGKAAQFFRVEGGCVENFEDLRVMFMERFQGGDVVSVEMDFHQCQQNPGELVVDYAQRFKVLATRLYDGYIQAKPVQMTILRKFLGGLNGDIQRWVCSRNPRNFEEAFEIARKEEVNLRMSRRKGGNAEWEGNEKVPKYLEDTLARLELLTRNLNGNIGDEELDGNK